MRFFILNLKGIHFLFLPLCTIIVASFGCGHVGTRSASRTIAVGDPLEVDYTCRIKEGPVLTTTEESRAEELKAAGADLGLFLPRRTYEPLELIAGEDPQGPIPDEVRNLPSMQLKGLHEVIAEALSEAVIGKGIGKRFSVEVTAEAQMEVPQPERMIRLRRARSVPRQLRLARDEFMPRTGSGRPPEVGMSVGMYQGMTGKVTTVTVDEVVIAFEPKQDGPVQTPFGEKKVYPQDDRYVIRTDTKEGYLVRTGPQIGRISEVEPGMFTVDYSHPFGGEVLVCDVFAQPAGASSRMVVKEDPESERETGKAGEDGIKAIQTEGAAERAGAGRGDYASTDTAVAASVDKSTALKDEEVKTAEEGDLVQVHFTAALGDGRLLHTTLKSVAQDPNREKYTGFQQQEHYIPETLLAGKKAPIPGLGEALVGMDVGEKKEVVLPPQRAFGAKNPSLVKEYDAVKRYPQTDTLAAKHWQARMKEALPIVGETYQLNPYLDATVTEVSRNEVSVFLTPRKNEVEERFGKTTVEVVDDMIEVTLHPKMGAAYHLENKQGRVVATDGRQFTVDFNPPLAGKTLMLDLEVVSSTKAATFEGVDIPWEDDYDEGLAHAEEKEKPMVLVLYQSSCSWSRKLLEETLTDPRVKLEKDHFVWTKVESPDPGLKEIYGLTGYPLTILLSPEGEVLAEVNGYKDATSFSQALKEAQHKYETGEIHHAGL